MSFDDIFGGESQVRNHATLRVTQKILTTFVIVLGPKG